MALTLHDGTVTPYKRSPVTSDIDTILFLNNELRKLELTIQQLVDMTPQVATNPPTFKKTGMIRFNKAPWNPLGTGDGKVYWNGTAWVLL